MPGDGWTLRTHLLLLRPRRLGECLALLALHLWFGGHALPLWSNALRSFGRLRGSFGQGFFLCQHRGLLFCRRLGLLLRWGRAGSPALLRSPEAPGGRGLLLGGCRRLGGHGCRCGRSLLAGGRRLMPRGAGGWRLRGRQWHWGGVAEAAFEQPLSLAVQAQPFVLLQKNRRKSPVEILGASPQQGSRGGTPGNGAEDSAHPNQVTGCGGACRITAIPCKPSTSNFNPEPRALQPERYHGCSTGIAHSPPQSLSITSFFIVQPCDTSVLSEIKQSKADYYRSLTLLSSIQLLSCSDLFSLIQ